MSPSEPDPLELAARALRHRDRTRAELEVRLARAGVDDAQRTEALDTLERIRYVDDERYATARAEALAARGRGDAAILFELEQHGLPRELIESAVAALEPEAARARTIATRGGETAKIAARLARNGFSAEAIEAAVGPDVAPAGDGDV